MTPQVSPISVRVLKSSTQLTVTAAAGSAGQSCGNTNRSLYASITNVGSEDCEYRVGSGPWLTLGFRGTANLDIDLSTSTVYLRKVRNSSDIPVVIQTAVAAAEYLAGDDVLYPKPSNLVDATGVYLMGPGSGVAPSSVVAAGTGWSLTSQGFEDVNGEPWYKVVMTGTGAGIGQMDIILTGLRPFAADSLQVEYMANHSQGGPLSANLSVDTNFSSSVGVYTNGRNMTTPNSGDPLMHSGRNSATWTKGGMSVQGASFVISEVEPVIGKPWTGLRIRRAINNFAGTMTFWLRSVRAGVNARKGRLAIMADDGYHSWFRLGAPILARYGIVSTAAVIPAAIGTNTAAANGNATLEEVQAYVRAGNFCVGHGPNSGDASLFLGSLVGGAERTADRVADMVFGRDYLLANGLASPAGAACYVWPQGTYNLGAGDTLLLDAAYEAGFRLGRCAGAYPLLLQKINALSPRSHSRLTIPIIGHSYAGTTNSPDNAAETTNINNIIGYIQKIAEGGCDGVLMLHRVVNRGTATAGSIEIETDRLAALCASIQTLVAAGTLECVGFEQLA